MGVSPASERPLTKLRKSYRNVFDKTTEHPRRILRLCASTSAAIGLLLAFITMMVTLHHRWGMNSARLLIGLSMIPLGISIIWNHIDLFSPKLFNRSTPKEMIVLMDGLGMCAFLALFIANAVDVERYSYREFGIGILLTYNQFPWIVCCAIHAYITLQELPRLDSASSNRICSRCRRESDTCIKIRGDDHDDDHHEYYAPLANRDSYDDDPEALIAASPISLPSPVEEVTKGSPKGGA